LDEVGIEGEAIWNIEYQVQWQNFTIFRWQNIIDTAAYSNWTEVCLYGDAIGENPYTN